MCQYLSEDCIFLILEKVNKDNVIRLTCSSLDFLLSKGDKDDMCLYTSLPRFLFGIKIGTLRLDKDTCDNAARRGNLEVLKYAHENGCPWSRRTCACAALRGHLEVLKYAHENGCPWNFDTCTFAAYRGQLEVLKYLHENGCPWDPLLDREF